LLPGARGHHDADRPGWRRCGAAFILRSTQPQARQLTSMAPPSPARQRLAILAAAVPALLLSAKLFHVLFEPLAGANREWVGKGAIMRSDTAKRTPLEQQRVYGAVRTALIGYGAAAYAYFFFRAEPGSAHGLVLSGIALQLLLVLARALIKRYAPDRASATQGMLVLELAGDGVTVLLFALATLGAITKGLGDL